MRQQSLVSGESRRGSWRAAFGVLVLAAALAACGDAGVGAGATGSHASGDHSTAAGSLVRKAVAARYAAHPFGAGYLIGDNQLTESGQVAGYHEPVRFQQEAFSWTIAGGVTILPQPNGRNSAPALNDVGQVLGYIDASDGSARGPFIWRAGDGLQYLPVPDNSPAEMRDLNNHGVAVGATYPGGLPFLTSLAGAQLIPLPGGIRGSAARINDAGQVLGGYSDVDALSRVFFWSAADGSQDVPPPGTFDTAGRYHVYPLGINDSGTVLVRYSGDQTGDGAYVWSAQSGAQAIPGLPLEDGSLGATWATALNNAGQVVGASSGRPLIWSASTGTRALLPADASHIVSGEASAINASGQVAGHIVLADGWQSRAVVWTETGEMIDLNDRIDPALGLTLIRATRITDSGYILALGADFRRVVLAPESAVTPTPPPLSASLRAAV